VRRLHIEGQAASEPGNLPQVSLINIGQRYFDVVGATTIAGRTLTTDDVRQATDLAVVNERFARMHFQDGSAIGKRILLLEQSAQTSAANDTRWMTIVGVIANIRQRRLPSGEFDPVVYSSYVSTAPRTMEIVARSALGPSVDEAG